MRHCINSGLQQYLYCKQNRFLQVAIKTKKKILDLQENRILVLLLQNVSKNNKSWKQ